MEIQGRIIAVLPMKSGRTAKGEWKVQQYVLETDDKYPKRLLFDLFGENKINPTGRLRDSQLRPGRTPKGWPLVRQQPCVGC